jgi:benzoyl-CoA 2,3-dioxygenase component B
VYAGEKLWESVPDDYYTQLFHHIRIQADVENGGVEQGQQLIKMAPSFHDLTNLFQFLLEEGRHSWAMVHLLLEHFGHDGMVESEALLERMCGDSENPRLLDGFNYTTDDWLAHFMWLFLADRDGKYQLSAVTDAAFAPLARAARFMLYEEPLHINIGVSGLERTLYCSAQATLMKQDLDVLDEGVIPLPIIQKYLNFWVPRVLDLFGNDESTRAYNMYQIGVRSPKNIKQYEDSVFEVDRRQGDSVQQASIEFRYALNYIMRQQYIDEIAHVVGRWNDALDKLNVDFQFKLPHQRFNRRIGPCKDIPFDVDGRLIEGENAAAKVLSYLPTREDYENVSNLMQQVLEPGEYASWIAPPAYNIRTL